MSMRYSEYRHWSIELGTDAARLSMYDAHGGEHYAVIPMDGKGKQNRETRYRALEAIEASIVAGNDPGEVQLMEQTA